MRTPLNKPAAARTQGRLRDRAASRCRHPGQAAVERSGRRPASSVTRSQTRTAHTTASQPVTICTTPRFACERVYALMLRPPCMVTPSNTMAYHERRCRHQERPPTVAWFERHASPAERQSHNTFARSKRKCNRLVALWTTSATPPGCRLVTFPSAGAERRFARRAAFAEIVSLVKQSVRPFSFVGKAELEPGDETPRFPGEEQPTAARSAN